jgi:hypothetical protein
MASCAVAQDRFPLVLGEKIHRDYHRLMPFCSFLGLFAPVQGRDAQIRSTAHMVLPAESVQIFALGIVLQHHPYATERIATLRFAQRRKIAIKIFLKGCRSDHLHYFDPLTTTQVN